MAVNTPYKKSTATTTNHTANYDLPLWAGEDTTSWLTQMNDAMNKIDDGMVDAKSKALEVVGIAADAKKLADETKAESAASAKIVAGYNDRLTAAEEKIVEHTQDITNLNTRSDQFDVELHSVQEVQKKTTADLATLAAKVDTNKSDADAKISANTAAIAKTDENVATVTGKVTALETEVGEVSSDTQSNTNAISAINTTIDGIKAKDTEQDGQISTINTEVSSLDSRVTALEDGGGTFDPGKCNSVSMVINATDIKLLNAAGVVTSTTAESVTPRINATATLFSDGTVELIIHGSGTRGGFKFTHTDSEIGGFRIFAQNSANFWSDEFLTEVLGRNSVWCKNGGLTNTPYGLQESSTAEPTIEAGSCVLRDVQISTNFILLDVLFPYRTVTVHNVHFPSALIFIGHVRSSI